MAEQPSETHVQLYAAGWLLRSTEYIDAFPGSPPNFKLRWVENLPYHLRKLKGFYKTNYIIKSTFVIRSLKSKHTKDCLSPLEAPNKQLVDVPFWIEKWKREKTKMRKAISENNETVLVVSFKHTPKGTYHGWSNSPFS